MDHNENVQVDEPVVRNLAQRNDVLVVRTIFAIFNVIVSFQLHEKKKDFYYVHPIYLSYPWDDDFSRIYYIFDTTANHFYT